MVLDWVEETHSDACAVERIWIWGYQRCVLLTRERTLSWFPLGVLYVMTKCCSYQ